MSSIIQLDLVEHKLDAHAPGPTCVVILNRWTKVYKQTECAFRGTGIASATVLYCTVDAHQSLQRNGN